MRSENLFNPRCSSLLCLKREMDALDSERAGLASITTNEASSETVFSRRRREIVVGGKAC